MKRQVNYASVTPNCPTLVVKTPVLYYIQFDVQNDVWLPMKSSSTSVFSSLTAWQIARIKNDTENESQP